MSVFMSYSELRLNFGDIVYCSLKQQWRLGSSIRITQIQNLITWIILYEIAKKLIASYICMATQNICIILYTVIVQGTSVVRNYIHHNVLPKHQCFSVCLYSYISYIDRNAINFWYFIIVSSGILYLAV